MNVDMISRDQNLPVARVRSLQIIKNEISRLEKLSKDVLYFSRSTCKSNCSFKLGESINEISSLLSPQLAEQNISLINNLSPDALAFGDKHSIKSMFMHLVENSIESIKQSGLIELWNGKNENNHFNTIFIRDTGEGIKEPENIFKLFFTSKSAGTGLGLSIAKKIVEDHSGSIELTSYEKGNTIFKITLPRGSV
jgi:signal transduction histidine kinase